MCEFTCVNLASDNLNCGACGTACDSSSVCSDGACKSLAATGCPAGQMMCGNACKDTQVDVDNCGTCGNACTAGGVCDAGACVVSMWEPLAPMSDRFNWTGFVPAGSTDVFGIEAGAFVKYTLPTTANPLGVYDATVQQPTTSVTSYSTPTQIGTKVYVVSDASMQVYDIPGNAWSTPIDATLTHTMNDAQCDHDDDGAVYVWSQDRYLVKIKVADNSVEYTQGPPLLNTNEPRAAYDSQSKKLYLADYDDYTGALFSFDPATKEFSQLASFPDVVDGIGDAFCSDRAGRIFATSSGDTDIADVWVYTIASNTWSRLPNLPTIHGSSPSCFVANGYLYVSNGDTDELARLKL